MMNVLIVVISSATGDCVDNSMAYETDQQKLAIDRFIRCITTHFKTEMGARRSCLEDSVRSDNDTNVKKTMTLLQKDKLFHTFMADTLNAGKILSSYGRFSDIGC